MSDIATSLLKNGIKGLANLEEDYFKENITHVLAFKLNESLKEIYEDCSRRLLIPVQITENTDDLKFFVEFIENFKSGKYEFKNNIVLNITDSDVDSLKRLFEVLSPENRKKMVVEVFQTTENFKQHIEFYNQSKGLLK